MKAFPSPIRKASSQIFTTNRLCCLPFPFFCPPTYIFRSFCLFSSLFFNFQYLRKRYETKVVGNVSSYCSKPFFILMKSKKRKKIGPFYMYFLQEYYTKYACKKALIPLFFRFHQNKKKLGTVTWNISNNFCFILFPEILKIKKKYTGFFIKCDFSKNTFFSGFSNYAFLNVLIFAHLLVYVAALAIWIWPKSGSRGRWVGGKELYTTLPHYFF